MKKLIILLSFLMLISLSCVSAADDVNETLEINEQDLLTADAGTFQALQAKINQAPAGSTINLENDYVYSNDVNPLYGISIGKQITINGNGHTIDGLHTSQIFNIKTESLVTFNNIRFVNGQAHWHGGAIGTGDILSYGNIRVDNCYFIDNNAEVGGGAFEVYHADVSNSHFINNHAEHGGAFQCANGANIVNCEFRDNSAELMGGAVYILGGYQWDVPVTSTIRNSRFINNHAESSGAAALYCKATITDCEFSDNYADTFGAGALYIEDGSILKCKFTANHAPQNGGAVCFSSDGTGEIRSCSFNGNHVNDAGGAVYGNFEGYRLEIRDCNFTANHAELEGGAVYGSWNIFNSNFNANTVDYTGGAVCGYGDIYDCVFNSNSAKENGGAISSALTVSNSKFTDNSVTDKDSYGAAISGAESVEKCEFTDNKGPNVISSAASVCGNVFKSSANSDEFIHGTPEMTLKNNKMTSNNRYDIKIDCFETQTMAFDLNLVFENRTVAPNSTIELCQFQDDSQNKIVFEPEMEIKVKLTNRDTKATEDITLYYDSELSGYYFKCELEEGTYDVTGSAEINNYHVLNGVLVVDGDTNYTLTANDLTKYYHGSERFGVTVTNTKGRLIAGIPVQITVNGQTYTRTTDSRGVASMAINLNSGTYPVRCECGEAKANATITVLKTISGDNVTKIFRNGTQYYATFIDTEGNPLKNTDVEFNINGVFYKRPTNDRGVARMNINLNPGEYIITAKNPSTDEMYTNLITVLTNFAEHNDLTKYYKNASQYRIRILADDGSYAKAGVKVTFNINGVFYERYSDDDGYVKMNINLEPGEYIITADYNGLRASNKITVKSVIETENLEMFYRDGSKFNATILDGQGNPNPNQPVTFNINGVFYDRISDENGVAGLAINLMAGEYIITTSYNGMNTANKVTIRVKWD